MARGLTDAAAAPATPSDAPAPTQDLPGDADDAGSDRDDRHPWRHRLTRPGALGLALTLLPFAVGAIVLLLVVGGDYHPVHDLAQTELRVRDVGRHEVLLGPYSREGWYHPGPAMFYLLAIPYRLFGSASVGMDVGALVINGAAVAGMALIARRRGGRPLLVITLLACGLLVRSLGPDFVRDPWNPSLPVLAFGLVLFLSWSMTCGEIWALPTAAAVATFVVQTHIGYMVLALPLVLWGAAWLVVLAVRRPDQVPRRRLARAGLVTAGVGLVLWALPLFEQATTEPGNLRHSFGYFRWTTEPGHTLAEAWRVLAAQFTLDAEWITGTKALAISGEPTALYGAAPIPLLLVPLALAVVVLWRRGSADARRLVLTLGLALVLGLLAVMNTKGLAFMYRLRWVEVLAMTAGVLILWAGWLVVVDRAPASLVPRLGMVAAATVVVLAAVNTVSQVRAGTPQEHDSAAMAALLPEVEAALPPGDEPVVVRVTSFGSMLFGSALQLGLEREGVDARIEQVIAAAGEHRLYRGEPRRATFVIVVDGDIAARRDDPDLELVAEWGTPPPPGADDPVTLYEQAFPTGNLARLEQLARATIDDAEDLEVPFTIRAIAVFSATGDDPAG